jgi:hypothetical protein
MFRRGLALILLAGVAVVAAAPLAAEIVEGGSMACCRDGAKMACCLPSLGCEMKGCAPGDRDVAFPGLEPALLDSPSYRIDLALVEEHVLALASVSSKLAPAPPERPPRG